MDVEVLARLQFAFTAAFHYLYPPLSIGLGLILVIMEGMYLYTGQEVYKNMTRFWVKIFALIFGIGVATGIVLEFEFGTNWATYSRYVGDIFGSALAAEGIFAFFLESGFLAILVFGWDRVSPKVHFLSTIMVSLGSTFSAVWIVVANSWMQTPTGYHIVGDELNARAEIVDFWAMVFNPSSVDRLTHVILGSYLAGAFLVISVAAYYLFKQKHIEFAKRSLVIGLIVATLSSFAQLISGHSSAEVVAEHQPAKLAAFEGHYPASAKGDLYLFGWVDEEEQKVHGVAIPGMLSFLLTFDTEHKVTGLEAFKEEDRPPVNFVFQTYHGMVAIGLLLIVLSIVSWWLFWRKKLFHTRWWLYLLSFSVLLPQIANQLGWYSAEVGRQPWIVYNLLRTSDALSVSVKANQVMASIIMFGALYTLLFILFIYLMNKKIKHGPKDVVNMGTEYEKRRILLQSIKKQ